MIIYQVYPRSFQDTNADGVGDLPGITRRLPHIASLGGVEFVWISPFFCSPMKDFGYDVSDYRRVDPIFGREEDFDEMIQEADRLGLKIMVDLVLCHTSDRHDWFAQSRVDRVNPKADWYVWADPKPDGTAPNNWMSVFGGPAWTWEPRRRQYYLHHFLKEQPALNFYNSAVETEMFDTVRYWIGRGVKGFRLDAIVHAHHDPALRNNPADPHARMVRPEDPYDYQITRYSRNRPAVFPFLRALRRVADEYPGIHLLGEVSDRSIARAYCGPGLLHSTYFFDLLRMRALDPGAIRQMVEAVLKDFRGRDFFWALSNHDFARHVTRLGAPASREAAFAKLCAALFLSLPGGYCLYQGEEFGLPAADLAFEDLVDPFDIALWPEGQQRDRGRTPVPWESDAPQAGFSAAAKTWLPLDPRHRALAADAQDRDPGSVLSFYRRMMEVRKRIRAGVSRVVFRDVPPPLLAFVLEAGKAKGWEAVFNLGDRIVDLPGECHGTSLDPVSCGVERASGGGLRLASFGFAFFQL